MNKFPLEIDGKEYIFTVTRRTNKLAKTPKERLGGLLDNGVSPSVMQEFMGATTNDELFDLMQKNNVPASVLITMNEVSIEDYEDMFYNCIAVEHPMDRESAMQLLDKAEEEYGWDTLTEALEVMSAQGFTSSAADNKKSILWLENTKAQLTAPPKKSTRKQA